jgi:hypothetical protein
MHTPKVLIWTKKKIKKKPSNGRYWYRPKAGKKKTQKTVTIMREVISDTIENCSDPVIKKKKKYKIKRINGKHK